MKYYIEEQAWEVILSFFKERNGIHNKNEEKIRRLLKQYSLLLEQVVNNVFYLTIMVVGTVFITDLRDGLIKVYGML